MPPPRWLGFERWVLAFVPVNVAVEAVIGELVSLRIPCFAGKCREIFPLEASDGDPARPLANKFRAFPANSLRIGTGNFAD
jgi:hypothetical protein